MGYNTVAVLYNDCNFAKEPEIGPRIAEAMRGWSMRSRDRLATHFGAGVVISQEHADYIQIVAVGRNSGAPIQDVNDLDDIALRKMAECLIRHGWSAKPPSKRQRKEREETK